MVKATHNRMARPGGLAVAALVLMGLMLAAAVAPAAAAAPARLPAPELSVRAQVTPTVAPEGEGIESPPTLVPASEERDIINGNQLVTANTFTLRSNQTLRGDLSVFGGVANLEEGSRVEGSLSVFGGDADVAGYVKEDLNVVGGRVRLRASAVVDGDLSSLGGSVTRDTGSTVRGESNRYTGPRVVVPRVTVNTSNSPFRWLIDLVSNVVATLFGILLATLFSVAAIALFPNNAARTAGTMTRQWAVSGALGVLTYVAVPILLVITAITICLIPVTIVLALAWAVTILFGWAIAARIVGERLMVALKQNHWTLVGQTAVGAIVLALLGTIPILGWLVGFLASSVGIGALILTRYGTQDYPRPPAPAMPVALAPYVPGAYYPAPVSPVPAAPQPAPQALLPAENAASTPPAQTKEPDSPSI